jgi:flagellar hook-associated protein 2
MSSVGGLDVNSIVSQLMEVERQPVTLLTNRKTAIQKKADAYDSLKTLLDDITKKAEAFDTSSEWDLLKASSSSTAVTTSVGTGGFSGSLTFKVNDLATSQKLYSTSTLASTSAKVTTADKLLLAAGGWDEGFAKLSASNDLGVGSHTVIVTQASAAAVKTGTAIAGPHDIDASDNTIELEVDGVAHTLTLADATGLDNAGLASAINTAIGASGAAGRLTAGVTSTGHIELRTAGEGSAATIEVTGGSALATAGLTVDGAALTGTDAKVTVDGTETVLTSVQAGADASLSAGVGKGTVEVTFAGGLRAGTVRARNVDLGDGSLSAVVSAINNSGGDVGASAIKVGDGAYRFQIQSKVSGVAGRFNFDTSVFDGAGAFSTLTAGTDASIEVTGSSPLTITSASNTFTDVLPGVSFTVNSKPADPVTVNATRDQDSLAAKVQGLVDSANRAVNDIRTKTTFNKTTNVGGVLNGDYTVRRLQSALNSAVTTTVVGGDIKQAGQVGITVNKDGTMAFDKAKFMDAYTQDPAAVQRYFFAPDANDANPGLTQRIAKAVSAATDSTGGYIASAAKGRKDAVADITKQINRWEDRLETKQTNLTRQFAALSSALSSLGQQSSWISNQLASLA